MQAIRTSPKRAENDGIWLRLKELFAVHPDRCLLTILLVIAAIPRLIVQIEAPFFVSADTRGYLDAARELVRGELPERMKRPPGYPFALAVTYVLAGDHFKPAVAALQHSLGLVTVGLTYLLGRSCFNRWVGFGAALLVAISGPQLLYEHTLLTEGLFELLLVGLALAMLAATRARTIWPAILVGVLLGLSTLVKPPAQILLPVGMIIAAMRPATRGRRLLAALAVAVVYSSLVGPWMLRNLDMHNRFSIGGTSGESLFRNTTYYNRGTFVFDSPNLPPASDPKLAKGRRVAQDGIDKNSPPGAVWKRLTEELKVGELGADRFGQRLALEVIQRQPLDYIMTIPRNAWQIYVSGDDDSWIEPRSERKYSLLGASNWAAEEASRRELGGLFSIYRPDRLGILLPLLAMVGLVAAWRWRAPGRLNGAGAASQVRRRRARVLPVLVPAVIGALFVGTHLMINGPVPRYRLVAEPLLNVLAFGGIWAIWRLSPSLLSAASCRLSTGVGELATAKRTTDSSQGSEPRP